MKVVITPRGFASYGQEFIKKMENAGIEVDYNDTGKAYVPEVFLEKCKKAEGIIVGVDLIDEAFLEACKNLKVICKFGVGTDNIDLVAAEKKGIYVGRTIGSNSKAVAEHVLSFMMMASKNLYATVKAVKGGDWSKPTGFELNEKTLGIIGFGTIGKYLASFVKGLDMRLLVHDSMALSEEVLLEYGAKSVSLDELLKESDYISLHVPLIRTTKNMIAERELALMKNTAVLINTARGGIVDEEALFKALTEGQIASACFDVFSVEPPPENAKLLSCENFYLTPHIAARTVESEKRTCQMSSEIVMQKLLEK